MTLTLPLTPAVVGMMYRAWLKRTREERMGLNDKGGGARGRGRGRDRGRVRG